MLARYRSCVMQAYIHVAVVSLLGLSAAWGTTLELIRPSGGGLTPSPNPPMVEAVITGVRIDDHAATVTVDGMGADLLPEADGSDNDLDGMVDEQGEHLVSWPEAGMSRFIARWPWALAADDPSTPDNEGAHTLRIIVEVPGETLERTVRFAVFSDGGVDSLLVCPSPFDPFQEGARIGYRARTAGSLRIRVYDFQGREVAIVRDWSLVEPGWHFPAETWDGRGDDGKQVGNGVYFVRIEFDNDRWIEEMVEPCLVSH